MKRYTAIEICAVFDEGKQEGFLLKMLKEGPNQAKIPRKRIKFQEVMEKEEEDGISALPDCLILEILCRLPSTKDAIRTGTLSKRWANLWTWVPTLLFRHFDIPLSQCLKNPNSRSNFPLLVEKTLTQCRQLKLKKFQMHTKYDIRFEAQFNNCIRHAVRCNVEKLSLEFLYTRREAEFQLDQFFFVNSCFTDLRLVGCTLNPSGAVSWKNLKSLCISTKNLDVDVMVNILSGSPLVETLVLKDCYGDTGLNITSDDESESESEAHIIGINAPNSSSLSQCRQLQLKKFTVVSDFDNEFQSQLNSWIRYAIRCNVKEIVLILWNTGFESELTLDQTLVTNSCLTELRLDGCMVNPIGAISWRSLRSLYISYRSLDEDLIENILSGSPVLVTLELNDCYGHRRLDITSKSVKNLVLSGFSDFYDESVANIIEINAPNILSLTIKHVLLSKLLLVNVSSLVKANLNYVFPSPRHHPTMTKEAEQDTLKGFIMNLGHVKELQIGYLCSEVFSSLQAGGFIFPSNVKRL
ncbi:F-box/LRR-repeat protein At5g02910 [Lactuca sativa]|nr:F-box/LRR-repeat protein At5g02910 [Lactuca sativa]